MAFSVFVSYSHNDVALVTPIMELLRLNKALVFQDTARPADESHRQIVAKIEVEILWRDFSVR